MIPVRVPTSANVFASLSPTRSLLENAPSERSWQLAAWGVALTVAIFRILYLRYACPYDLAPDEAHYWDWSRHLDWSYYSKGPGVAWLIAASTGLFGHEMWAVRLPAVLCGSLTLIGLFDLTRRVYRDGRLALAAMMLALTIPPLAVGSLLMTIDPPFVCCWMWALVATHVACFPGPRRSLRDLTLLWFALGCLIGLGILFKYTMVLSIPSLLLFAISCRFLGLQHVRLPSTPRDLVSLACPVVVCLAPIVIWNANHGWVTLLHVGRQAGVQGGGVIWLGPLHYLAGQFGALFGFWFIFILGSVLAAAWKIVPSRRDRESLPAFTSDAQDSKAIPKASWIATDQAVFLLSFFVPTFVVFFAFSLKTKIELNWPVTAYLSGGVLAAGWVLANCRSPVTWWRKLSQGLLATAAVIGLAAVILMHRTDWLYPLLPIQGAGPDAVSLGPRRWDPTCRLRGWRTLAAEVDALRGQLRKEGIEPVLIAGGWALPGEIAFYLPDHPQVYSIGSANGGRLSQYDFWRPNPVWDPEAFRGRTMICVGDLVPTAHGAFGRIEPTRYVVHEVAGHPVAVWSVTVCHEFQGFDQIQPLGY
ncbi:MAG: glycosyltransferase family 39 protein [Gemmatales bacterium]|nr:glycosyltransferase family 39 protein [Gemmatales bacterium]MDW8385844.1 glycosyltransferase family 39 protein [Gemmatales bacterium]